jgi:hypothetical protein
MSLWCAKVVLQSKSAGLVQKETVLMLEAARAVEETVSESFAVGLPYPYYHIAIMMVFLTLLVKSYTLGMTGNLWSPIVNFILSLMLISMLDLAKQLSDPFGQDDTDFPVDGWVGEMIESAVLLMEYTYPEKARWAELAEGDHEEFAEAVTTEVPLSKGEWYMDVMAGSNRLARPPQRGKLDDKGTPETWLNMDAPYCKGVETQIWLQTVTPRAGLLREQRNARVRAGSETASRRNIVRSDDEPAVGSTRWPGAEFLPPGEEDSRLAIAPAMGRSRFTQAPSPFSRSVPARGASNSRPINSRSLPPVRHGTDSFPPGPARFMESASIPHAGGL